MMMIYELISRLDLEWILVKIGGSKVTRNSTVQSQGNGTGDGSLSILETVLLNPRLNYPNNLNLGLITLATISADEYCDMCLYYSSIIFSFRYTN